MLAVGEILQNRYRVVREIGAGGMGTVYEGENLLIRRRVAIKVMRSDASNSTELCARFEREAQIASQIPSDHITEVLDMGELESGQRFIVMEYLVGESLSERLNRATRLPVPELLGLVRQALSALGAAHRVGVIHRDIKPDNVFILSEKAGYSDFVKLLDFGISKIPNLPGEATLTQSGMFVGTPSYMAPEQVSGGAASSLWDLYSMGVILYRGLTGETPYKSQQLHELVYKVALGNFVRPSERVASIDAQLDALVCKAMSRFPEQRFQNADEFITAIDAWLDGPGREQTSPSSRPPPRVPLLGGTRPMAGSRVPTPQGAMPTTRLTTELGISDRLRSSAWRGWAALGVVVFGAAVAVSLWRLRAQVDAGIGHDVLSAQPASASLEETGRATAARVGHSLPLEPPSTGSSPSIAPVLPGAGSSGVGSPGAGSPGAGSPGAGSPGAAAPVSKGDRPGVHHEPLLEEDEADSDPVSPNAAQQRKASRATRRAERDAERKRGRAAVSAGKAPSEDEAARPEREPREQRKERPQREGDPSAPRPDWGY
ncbi:MAG: hypothetical protein RL685_6434 [Pseudomonadota bacterium]|jgi:serine/threonine-protein kinase